MGDLSVCYGSSGGVPNKRQRTRGRLADATVIDGAVLNPNLGTGLYTISSLLGSAHAGTPAQDQGEADTRMTGGWFDLLFFRSTSSQASWSSSSGYDYLKFAPYKLYRRSAKGLGWAGHTWEAFDVGNIYPKDDGTAVNLLTSSIALPWGLYFLILTTWLPSADGGPGGTDTGSNNDAEYMVRTTGSVTDATLTDFVWQFPGFPGDNDILLTIGNGYDANKPLTQQGCLIYGGSTPGPYKAFAQSGSPGRLVCIQDDQVVRFRVNRLEWSA